MDYSKYLKVDELLQLQKPLSDGPEHDEMLFITIHQVYELWFKQLLHELDYLHALLEKNDSFQAHASFKRILTILKIMVAQVDILETMTPLSFASFRSRLESSSGFQSLQFRKLEFMLGHKRESAFQAYENNPRATSELRKYSQRPTLYDAFLKYLKLNNYDIPPELLNRDVTQPLSPNLALQGLLIDIYKKDRNIANMCERLVDLDEGLQEWRYRHVKMVERTIGTKMGTGGSSGAEYLVKTLFKPLFEDLWIIRSSF